MNIKSLSALVLTLMLFTGSAYAQFSAGLDLGIPSGNLSDIASTGFGLSGRYDGAWKDQLNWTASLGFMSFAGKTVSGFTFKNVTNVPIAGGVKYYFQEAGNGWYGAADLSINFLSYGVGTGTFSGNASTTRLGLSPGVGYRMGKFDFAARYNLITDFSSLGIRAAYIFDIKK